MIFTFARYLLDRTPARSLEIGLYVTPETQIRPVSGLKEARKTVHS